MDGATTEEYMNREELIELCTDAIRRRVLLEVDYSKRDGTVRNGRLLAPFDVGSRNPAYAERNYNKLYAFNAEHVDGKTGRSCPQVTAIAIELISRAVLTEINFDPEDCRQRSLASDGYDWATSPHGFNLLPDRDWFR
jgi:hypothetical protein